jgi:hypothetical protein
MAENQNPKSPAADPDIAEAFAAKFAKDSIPLKTPARVIYAPRWRDYLR